MDDVGGHLLGDERKAALFPGEPRRAVPEHGRPGDDPRAGCEEPVVILVRALAGDDEVSPGGAQGTDQAVEVAAERPSVSGCFSRVNQYPKCHSSQAYALPRPATSIRQ